MSICRKSYSRKCCFQLWNCPFGSAKWKTYSSWSCKFLRVCLSVVHPFLLAASLGEYHLMMMGTLHTAFMCWCSGNYLKGPYTTFVVGLAIGGHLDIRLGTEFETVLTKLNIHILFMYLCLTF